MSFFAFDEENRGGGGDLPEEIASVVPASPITLDGLVVGLQLKLERTASKHVVDEGEVVRGNLVILLGQSGGDPPQGTAQSQGFEEDGFGVLGSLTAQRWHDLMAPGDEVRVRSHTPRLASRRSLSGVDEGDEKVATPERKGWPVEGGETVFRSFLCHEAILDDDFIARKH